MEQWEKDFESNTNNLDNIANDDLKNVKKKGKSYLGYAILFVTIIVLGGITAAYAYFRMSHTNSSTPTNVTAKIDCMDINYSESDVINLSYQYPIQDSYAVANVVPVTVTVTNMCEANIGEVNYALALTSLANGDNYISDNKMRFQAVKKIGTDAETTFKTPGYLNSLPSLTEGNTFSALEADLSSRAGVSTYPTRTSYTLDTGSLGNGQTAVYKVYLWVDYYEGDTTHTGQNNNSTQGQKFAGAISLVVNP